MGVAKKPLLPAFQRPDHAGAVRLTGQLPFADMTESFLRLSNTLFFPHDEGTLPPDIGKLVALTSLSLGSSKVSGESAQLTLTIWLIMPVPTA